MTTQIERVAVVVIIIIKLIAPRIGSIRVSVNMCIPIVTGACPSIWVCEESTW